MTEIPDLGPPWNLERVLGLFQAPLNDLLYWAHGVHRRHFNPQEVQLSTLLSVKTGGCPEDCHYCPQSARYATSVEAEPLLPLEQVVQAARQAQAAGATRFCMGAAFRGPKDRDLDQILEYIRAVKALGLETCATLGLLTDEQAARLAQAGLDFYNHNLDTSRDYYCNIVTTRSFDDRLETLRRVRKAGMHVCCGGILGMGECMKDRAALLLELAEMDPPPESVPLNALVPVPGTPLAGRDPVPPLEFVRTVAVARILMPKAHVRLSAGRSRMSDELQALCFFAGANSIFYGEELLTTPNNEMKADRELFRALGIRAEMQPERREAHAPRD
jgi:biotin synthase